MEDFFLFHKIACILAVLLVTVNSMKFEAKLTPALIQSLQQEPARVNIFVYMTGKSTKSVLSEMKTGRTFATRGEKGTAIVAALTRHSAGSQKDVLAILNGERRARSLQFQFESFWISNLIFVKGADKALVETLAAMDQVSRIEEEPIVHLEGVNREMFMDIPKTSEFTEWGIQKIKAREAWAVGSNGSGVVLGIIDTGARRTHEAIRSNFKGGDYAWFDGTQVSETPYDDDNQGHGTHVTATAVGSHGVGVAPGAQWIACKGLAARGGSGRSLVRCGEWILCPTHANGQNPDCSQAPQVVSNSFGAAGGEWFDAIVEAWSAAGMIGVFAQGNSGPGCFSSDYPAHRDDAIAAGGTNITDAIYSKSGRGPNWEFDSVKPNVVAPGENVTSASSSSDTTYSILSGTSMATPHVAGLVCILVALKPGLTFEVVKQILQSTADRNLVFSGERCGGIPDNQFPNTAFGYGRINALAAVQAVLKS